MKFYFKLIRWPNLLIIIFTMLLIRYGVIYPFLKIYGFEFQLGDLNFALLILSTVLIAAGGYVINDYFDRKIDMTNKPDEVVVGTHIERRKAMSLHNVLTALGLALGFYLSYSIGRTNFAFVFIIISGALWFYSTLYKRQLIIGNILIAFLTGLVPLIVVLFDVPVILEHYHLAFVNNPMYYTEIKYMMYAVMMFAGFAFLTTIVREIIKDIQDLEGDAECFRNTIPVAWGTKAAKWIAQCFIIITIFALAFIYYIFLQGHTFSLLYVIIALVFPLLALMFVLSKAKTPSDFRKSSQFLKIIMILGLLYVVPFYMSVTSVS